MIRNFVKFHFKSKLVLHVALYWQMTFAMFFDKNLYQFFSKFKDSGFIIDVVNCNAT